MRRALLVLGLAACSSPIPVATRPTPPIADAAVTTDAAADAPEATDATPATDVIDAAEAQPVLDDAGRARIPTGGLWVAHRTDSSFFLEHITRTGIQQVMNVQDGSVVGFGWLDAHRLVLHRIDDSSTETITLVIDGVAGTPIEVPDSTWPAVEWERPPTLVLYRNGDVWLTHCIRHKNIEDPGSPCVNTLAAKITADAPIKATKKLPGGPTLPAVTPETSAWGPLRVAQLPHVAAPAGYSVRLFDTHAGKPAFGFTSYDKGWTCKGPKGSSTWPGDDDWAERMNVPTFRPRRLTWVSSDPPRYVLEADATDVNGLSHWTVLMRACDVLPVWSAAHLGGDAWAELERRFDADGRTELEGLWHVYIGPTEVARFAGSYGQLLGQLAP